MQPTVGPTFLTNSVQGTTKYLNNVLKVRNCVVAQEDLVRNLFWKKAIMMRFPFKDGDNIKRHFFKCFNEERRVT